MNAWGKLFSDRRLVWTPDVGWALKKLQSTDSRSPFERDYCKILYSTAFRRLGGKTQVFPRPNIDHVRNRLTHSLEVSSIANSILREFSERYHKKVGVRIANIDDVCWIVRTAGLSHDIGNPPFGHAGERAICSWASEFLGNEYPRLKSCLDFYSFDGNAQGFRFLSNPNLTYSSDSFYLTAASLSAIVKYPWSIYTKPKNKIKCGAFSSESDSFDLIMDEVGLKIGQNTYKRHPLSFVLEAADDISYVLSDIEDAIYMDILSESDLANLYEGIMAAKIPFSGKLKWKNAVRSSIADKLIRDYSKAILDSIDGVFSGEIIDEEDLCKQLPRKTYQWLQEVKPYRNYIFRDKGVQDVEKVGTERIKDILMRLSEILKFVGDAKKTPSKGIKSVIKSSIGSEIFEEKQHESQDWWAHMIVDYVSGMTDRYVDEVWGKIKARVSRC